MKNYKNQIKKCRAETQTNIIMWLGVIITIFISIFWLMKNIQPKHLDLETISGDLSDIQGHINSACNSDYYLIKYNPRTIKGNLMINNSNICINNTITKCRISLCSIEDNISILLDNITYVIIEKNKTFQITGEV
jgi:hypothetical protein